MSSQNHDLLANRLARILGKLNEGQSLDASELALEFGVNLRTIQRDLNERFAFLDIEKSEGKYRLNPACLGRLGAADVAQFASLAGVRGLFPVITSEFLREIFDTRIQSSLLVKGHHYEDLAGKERLFRQLEHAIVGSQRISFDLTKAEVCKSYVDVEPYKLVNHKGIWYLAAKDAGKLKTFSLARINRLLVSEQTFSPDPEVDRILTEDDGIWASEQQQEVVLQVSAEVAGFFKRRKLIANQVIEKELTDGGLILSSKVGHANQIVPIVRYWIPHVRILSPEAMQTDLERSLTQYLQR